eukprot:scaffold116_cov233-Pinguiococcus_pyrenoidosus.AAC.4
MLSVQHADVEVGSAGRNGLVDAWDILGAAGAIENRKGLFSTEGSSGKVRLSIAASDRPIDAGGGRESLSIDVRGCMSFSWPAQLPARALALHLRREAFHA